MALVPNGKRRLMVAQAAPNPANETGQLDTTGVEPGNVQMSDKTVPPEEAGGAPETNPVEPNPAEKLESEVGKQEVSQENSGEEGDVRKTVFDFLVGLGYPPRRLQEFKSQFVSETGSAGSGTQVSLMLPDEVYGKNIQIPRDKIKELVQSIEQKHALSFIDYKRSNEQLSLNFMTADAAQQQAMQDGGPGDILDKVYGKPSGKKGRMGPKGAKTIQEFIKEAKDRQHATLKMILGK